MLDPFALTIRLVALALRVCFILVIVCAYVFVGMLQGAWYLISGRPDQIGDALGDTGRAIIDAIRGTCR